MGLSAWVNRAARAARANARHTASDAVSPAGSAREKKASQRQQEDDLLPVGHKRVLGGGGIMLRQADAFFVGGGVLLNGSTTKHREMGAKRCNRVPGNDLNCDVSVLCPVVLGTAHLFDCLARRWGLPVMPPWCRRPCRTDPLPAAQSS